MFLIAWQDHNSGKTSTLQAIEDVFPTKKGIYITYLNAMKVDAQGKFNKNRTTCLTTHGLARQNTVVPMGLRIGQFNYRSISNRISFEKRILIVESIRHYCLSEFISLDDFCLYNHLDNEIKSSIKKYLGMMKTGAIECTHDFYLKMYHIMLSSGAVKHKQFDIIYLDEAGDLNPVTLEIFNLLPAVKKVMVGDEFQNVYVFNDTINGFKKMKGKGIHLSLTKSFRVANHIAVNIEYFCKNFMNANVRFTGMDYDEETLSDIRTTAFISRTNSTLIDEMIRLNEHGKEYGLTRPAKTIFELPLAIIGLKARGEIKLPAYKFLKQDYDDYFGSTGLQNQSSFYGYLAKIYSDDIAIKSAMALISKHGPKLIIQTHDTAKSHESGNHRHTLMTGHSSKGLEKDSVYIADDFHERLKKIISTKKFLRNGMDSLTAEELSEFNLYYVVSSRALYELKNAQALSWTPDLFKDNNAEAEFDNEMQSYLEQEENEYQIQTRG